MTSRRKPYDPAEKARRLEEEQRLIALGATLVKDLGGRVISARRSNVFNVLLLRKVITLQHYLDAEKLANDWATWKGLDGRRDSMGVFVDGGSGAPDLVTHRMMIAGGRVRDALESLTEGQRAVLEAFMVATVEEDRAMAWKGILERLGVKSGRVTVNGLRVDRQSYAVVTTCEALSEHYKTPRRRVA